MQLFAATVPKDKKERISRLILLKPTTGKRSIELRAGELWGLLVSEHHNGTPSLLENRPIKSIRHSENRSISLAGGVEPKTKDMKKPPSSAITLRKDPTSAKPLTRIPKARTVGRLGELTWRSW